MDMVEIDVWIWWKLMWGSARRIKKTSELGVEVEES